jgi:hypothetical protein
MQKRLKEKISPTIFRSQVPADQRFGLQYRVGITHRLVLKKMSERFESWICSRPHLTSLRKHLPSGIQQKQLQFP